MNTQLWKLYKESEQGKKTIQLFDSTREHDEIVAADIFKFQKNAGDLEDEERMLDYYFETAVNIEGQGICLEGDDELIAYTNFIDNLELKNFEFVSDNEVKFLETAIDKGNYRSKLSLLPVISLYLYFNYEFYKPILFAHNFSIIQRACDTLGIDLPPIPYTEGYRLCLLYYFDLCNAFMHFQEEYNLTDAEFCACLYDFSKMCIEEKPTTSEIPAPTNVWLTGASREDIKRIVETGISESVWACNERTRRGDIIILYALAPHSCIHSIWRASSGGQFNPFDYYHCRTTVQNGIIIPPISNSELKEHPYFSQLPIVRRNMQGVNGIEFSAQDYIELLQLIESKGFDIAKLPQLYTPIEYDVPNVRIEKDVEEKILIPLLEQLGYSTTDYTRQLSQKAGRKLKAIPDFVFFPHGQEHFHTAPFLIEAKYDMRSMRELNSAFEQALSYSRMLRNPIMGICDKERFILYEVKDGITNRNYPIFENHWAVIYTDTSVFHQLKKIIGRDVIREL